MISVPLKNFRKSLINLIQKKGIMETVINKVKKNLKNLKNFRL